MVQKVRIESDALQVCVAHAFSTEDEEVMGLLIGESNQDVTHVHAALMLRRLDKRKDRVEISPEQLSNASNEAESLGMLTRAKRPMRIVGWYHSHPHITVWPSHVDVRTQAMYQMMDSDFFGLIVSCYNDGSSGIGQTEVTCFQAAEIPSHSGIPSYERVEIAQEIVPCEVMSHATLASLLKLPEILLAEESEAYQSSLSYSDQDLLTAVLNGTVFTKSIMQIIEIICTPMLKFLEGRLKENYAEQDSMKAELKYLTSKLDVEGKT